ncbi:MAG: haloacid dehalogenase-like hydrolase [Acidimicrobiales bacterium]|jgi:phosphoglycolate phosphatase-like HAD superfamily hydrolase|nr:haloacid dehalogenase-like hydrolase [Acidimicrobiales bacterium]
MPEPHEVVALFDIDGTLLRAGDPVHHAAFDAALQEVFGVPATIAGVPLAGMLERQVARLALEPHGLGPTQIDERLEEVMRVMGVRYRAEVPVGARLDRLLPGVAASVTVLADAGVGLAVVTGNAEPVAHAKLAAAHLDHWFRAGAFGDSADDRAELVRAGIRAAAAAYHRPFRAEHAVVIGDTPRDVAAARGAGTRVIAVATGASTRDALAAAQPDVLLDDLGDPELVLGAVLGG